MLYNVAPRKDSHADVGADSPFRNVTVGVTAVVRKATYAAAFGSVDELGCVSRQFLVEV